VIEGMEWIDGAICVQRGMIASQSVMDNEKELSRMVVMERLTPVGSVLWMSGGVVMVT